MPTDTSISPTPLTDLDLFAGFSKSEMRAVQRLMTPVRIRAGRDLTREGETGREFTSLLDQNPRLARKVMVGAIRRLHVVDHGPAD